MESEDISALCASLSINSRDGPTQLLNEKLMVEAKHRLSLCVMGKVLTSKRVNREAFMRVIRKIWQVRKGMEIKSITGNTFTFHFRDAYNLERVMSCGPWSFDNALLAMERPIGKGTVESLKFNQADFSVQIHQVPLLCMTRGIGRFLGGMIGIVLEVDGGTLGDCVGKFMRVRVRVNIEKSLTRCLRVDIGDGVITTMNQKSLTFSPQNEGGFRRYDRGKDGKMKMPLERVGKERVMHDASNSLDGSSGSLQQEQRVGDVMDLWKRGASDVCASQKEGEEGDILMSNGTESGSINADEVVDVMCTQGNMGKCELAHLLAQESESIIVVECLEPNVHLRLVVNQIEERPILVCLINSQPELGT
ncbi:hypothetical protein EZV62_015264 [Acer yangbiense]|uniref:DUF4283 domain-containing protein n=1 Tax=Acer yangbiense TaxID=1000413 RepID=A0A5C7HUC6_9ROSI|nr:hypothetical protein EZV62_015264 [Acer yangbiense]